MPVRETGGGKLIIRITDADQMSDQAKRFMNKRLMPHNNDGNIWVLPSPSPVEIAAAKSLGFEFFARFDQPYEERSWAIRRQVTFLDRQDPTDMILWMSDDPASYDLEGRKFSISNKQDPEAKSPRFPIYTPISSEVVTQAFIEYCCQAYTMDHYGYHGFYHWMRVLQNGRHLAKAEGANIKVVELFCLLHDTQRRNEDYDPKHGMRAAQFAQTLRGTWFDVADAEMELLTEALIHHSEGYTQGDVTVRVCWDADRLDLGRVGIDPKPERLCTETARNNDVLFWAKARSKHKVL
ncbi:hypothetical protein N8015_04100 [Planktomarina temperata]|nr:hypothetical protein [Planktomarina temperata]